MSEKAIFCYICSWSPGSLYVYSLVGGLVPGSSECTGWYILLCLLWDCKPLPHTYGHLIFDKGAKTTQWEKKTAFSKNGAGSTDSQHVEGYKLIHSYLPVQSSSKDLHIKPDTLNLIEEKVGESLEYLGTGMIP